LRLPLLGQPLLLLVVIAEHGMMPTNTSPRG
jgi:hypothetical protein